MADDKAEATAVSTSDSGGAGPNKLVLILTGVNLIATLAIVGVLFVSFQKEKGAQKVADIVAEEPAAEGEHGAHGGGHGGEHAGEKTEVKKIANFGKMVTLDQFTVNLSNPGSVNPKFIRVNISVEVQNEDSEHELSARMPQVRNTIIDLFNSKRPADLATPDGMSYIKEEIRNSLNSFMVNGKVKGVFFTNFTISS